MSRAPFPSVCVSLRTFRVCGPGWAREGGLGPASATLRKQDFCGCCELHVSLAMTCPGHSPAIPRRRRSSAACHHGHLLFLLAASFANDGGTSVCKILVRGHTHLPCPAAEEDVLFWFTFLYSPSDLS